VSVLFEIPMGQVICVCVCGGGGGGGVGGCVTEVVDAWEHVLVAALNRLNRRD